ncbi:MAG: hypothetical protein AAFS06_19860 [Cyanobacteria bacterium J06631_12]
MLKSVCLVVAVGALKVRIILIALTLALSQWERGPELKSLFYWERDFLGERLSGRETLGEGEVIQLHLPESTGKQTPQVMAYTKWALALRFKWPTPVRMAMRSPSSRI